MLAVTMNVSPQTVSHAMVSSRVSEILRSGMAMCVLSVCHLTGSTPFSWAQSSSSLTVLDHSEGRVSSVTTDAIVIDGMKHRLAPHAIVKWDMGGPATLDDIRPGDLVQFIVKDLQVVLVVIVQPG